MLGTFRQGVTIRQADSIHRAAGQIENGTFSGRWHFSFGDFDDPEFRGFGVLLVFNDDVLSPGAVWPMHPHREIEVVTYCAAGEFRHADDRGGGGVLHSGDVQHTTVGRGMMHSELNNRSDRPMRFIQMWFRPSRPALEPAVQQRSVDLSERTGRLLALVSGDGEAGALPLASEAGVYAAHVEPAVPIEWRFRPGRGGYLYVVDGGPVHVDGLFLPQLSAAMIVGLPSFRVEAQKSAELLFVEAGGV